MAHLQRQGKANLPGQNPQQQRPLRRPRKPKRHRQAATAAPRSPAKPKPRRRQRPPHSHTAAAPTALLRSQARMERLRTTARLLRMVHRVHPPTIARLLPTAPPLMERRLMAQPLRMAIHQPQQLPLKKWITTKILKYKEVWYASC